MLVGRVAERARIDRFVEGLTEGHSGGLLIAGEAGTGKTALLGYARERSGPARTLAARGFEAESDLPYAGLSLLLRPVEDCLERVPPAQRRALEAALELGPPVAAERFAVYAGVLSILAAAAETAPLLVLVDDAQWLDAASLDALLFATRRLMDEGIGTLFAARDGERLDLASVGLEQLRLTGLDADGAAVLLEDRTGSRPSAEVVRRVEAATAGNPLALRELAGLLSEGQLEGSEPLQDPLPVGADVQQAFGRTLEALPTPAQSALLLAAAEPGAGLDVLERAAGDTGVAEALEPAEAAGLVSLSGGAVEFRHPLVRAVAYQRADPARRRAAHKALADALDPHAARARRAGHLARATTGTDEGVAAELQAVGHSALSRGAPDSAAVALGAAAELTPAPAMRIQRRLEAAQACGMAARVDQARIQLVAALAEAPDDPLLRADVRQLGVRIEAMTGAVHRLHGLLVEEAELVSGHDAGRAASLLADAAYLAQMDGRPRLGFELSARAQRLGTGLTGPAELQLHQSLGVSLLTVGRVDDAVDHLERGEAAVEHAVAFRDYIAAALAQAYQWAEQYGHARGKLHQIVDRARRDGVVSVLAYALGLRSWLDFRLGDWAQAYADVTESLTLGAATGQLSERAFSLVRLAELEAGRGEAERCRAHVEEAVALAEELGAGSIEMMAVPVLGLLDAGCGPTEGTARMLEANGRVCLERGLEHPMIVPWTQELADVYLQLGDPEGADRTLAVLERQAARSGLRTPAAVALRYRGLLADDAAEAEGLFVRALELHEPLPAPFDRARTELCFGDRLRRDGKRKEARAQLRGALATFERLGAAPWAERARRGLAATGLRARRRVAESRDELTAQELQVALVVAEGATNREAAARLYVSPKTIETHLSHAYRKLGVRSRTELARQLLGPGGGEG